MHIWAVAAALFFVLPFVFVFLDRADERPAVADPATCGRDPLAVAQPTSTVWQTPGFSTWWRNTLLYAVLGTALTAGLEHPGRLRARPASASAAATWR